MEKPPTLEPIEIRQEDGFTVRQGDRESGDLTWDEMLGQVVGLTHPKIRSAHYRMMSPAERADEEVRRARCFPVAKRTVRLDTSYEEAQELARAIQTLLIWANGVRAALPHNPERWPPHLEALRDFDALLKSEMARVENL